MAAAAVVTVSMGVMKPVLAKLTTLMGDEYRKLKGLRKMVTFLQRELKDMDALLEKMDSADELDPQAKNWRKDIIEMTYNIEDCIDDFMQRVGEANGKMGILRKASKYMRTFKDRHRLANQFQEITAQVMEASERRKRYMLDQSISITTPVVVDPRISAIYKDSASLVGIDAQKDELVNWAMDKEQQLKVMAIVGLGGLGKTTLANEVYRQVGGKFDCKAFVPVSQKPKMIGLFNSLLSQLGLDTYSHPCLLQDPINRIIRHLQDKRYFVVVDDLWDIRAWDTIRCAFPENNQCSRVMVTTRIDDVARSCCNNHGYIHNMKPLSEQDSRKLFFDRIFGSEDDCPSELRKPSSEILKKCDGLPLAIITMASMLACQQKRLGGRWEYIQNSLATKSATSSNYEDMMYILDLSYKNLPHHLKACFLYLGSYPEDHEISRDELVRRWVAEGFVSNSIGQHVWDVADSYFNELVNRSMIQLVGPGYGHYNKMKGIPSCRVHDMLLELITRRCKEDNFLSLVNDPQAVVEVQDKVIRRLSVSCFQCTEQDKVAIASSVNLERIRSLSIFKESNWIPSLLEFKFVRVLFFDIPYEHRNAIDLSVINQLPQLRYLKAVGYVRSDMLISCQIRGLRLLETLDLFGIHLYNISLEIVDAPRLSHLAGRSAKLPDRIGNVRSLLTLHGFILPIDSLESIIDLGNLTGLLELHLCFPKEGVGSPNKATWMAALATSLEKLSNLKRLVLDFPGLGRPVALCADELSSLSPPFGNLQVLDLQQGCTFSRVPRWIISSKLHNLRDLRIGVKQVLEEDVAMIGTRLPSLIHLCLRIPGVQTMERIVIGGSTGFPALKRFRFNCNGMSLLTFEAGAMPQLRELELLFDEDEWDMEAPGGLQHLPGLEQIIAHRVSYPDKAWINPHYRMNKAELEVLIMGVFQEAADALPTRPTFTFGTYMITPIEEEDYLEWVPI